MDWVGGEVILEMVNNHVYVLMFIKGGLFVEMKTFNFNG